MKRNLKLLVVPAIYALAITIFGVSMYLIQSIVNNNRFSSNENMEYVDKEIVTDNEVLGKTIKIRHNNDLISTYQSLGEVNVKQDDTVLRGQVIGQSGTSNLYNKDYNLHFELTYQGKNINPEDSYNKTEFDLQA